MRESTLKESNSKNHKLLIESQSLSAILFPNLKRIFGLRDYKLSNSAKRANKNKKN